MKTKIAFMIIPVLAGIAVGIISIRDAGPTKNSVANQSASAMPPPANTESVSVNPLVPVQPTPANQATPAVQLSESGANPVVADRELKINGYVVLDPTARMALGLVGSDPDADAYWLAAINDPNLPAEERKDLIEDLNEDGLVNPKLATEEDMPIIASRIFLIEEIAPEVMDPANARALAEAHKDLVNLYNGLPAD